MNRNSYVFGGLIGLISPVIAYFLTINTALQANFFPDKPIALYVIAAVINLLIIRFTFRSGNEKLAKGTLLITFAAMVLLIFFTKLKV